MQLELSLCLLDLSKMLLNLVHGALQAEGRFLETHSKSGFTKNIWGYISISESAGE